MAFLSGAPGLALVQQNEASDWADIMPRSGFVLYINALWYWVKKLYRLPGAEVMRDYANQLLYPFLLGRGNRPVRKHSGRPDRSGRYLTSLADRRYPSSPRR